MPDEGDMLDLFQRQLEEDKKAGLKPLAEPIGPVDEAPPAGPPPDRRDEAAVLRHHMGRQITRTPFGEELVDPDEELDVGRMGVRAEDLARLTGLIFYSKRDSAPHIVTVRYDSHERSFVQCVCEAMLSIDYRPAGCWAMKTTRALLGIPTPKGG